MRGTVAAVLIAACAGGDGPSSAVVRAPLDAPFTLQLGQSAVLEEPAVTITFTAVPIDSRCPTDVVCASAGDAVVRLTLHVGPPNSDGPDVNAELHVNQEPHSAPWGPYYELRLLALAPERRVDPAPTGPYRATMVMESR